MTTMAGEMGTAIDSLKDVITGAWKHTQALVLQAKQGLGGH